MEVIGWQVKPAGLILLVILIVLLATYIVGLNLRMRISKTFD